MDNAAHATRAVILGVTSIAAGIALYSTWRHSVHLARYRSIEDLWFICLNLGLIGVVLLIGELVFGAEGIPFTWRALLYGVCLALISVGLVGLAYTRRH